jgi:hypothetical protein
MPKMEAPALETRAASGSVYAGKLDKPEDTTNRSKIQRPSLYRRHPGCALLVKRTILRCGGAVRP